jgi:hypothetical protein
MKLRETQHKVTSFLKYVYTYTLMLENVYKYDKNVVILWRIMITIHQIMLICIQPTLEIPMQSILVTTVWSKYDHYSAITGDHRLANIEETLLITV